MKICLYIRLSSADDDLRYKTESESISNQRALLMQYLNAHQEFHPYEVVEFVDDGFSGTNGNRPSFERMVQYLKDGNAKLVICKDLSRFFRDYVEIGDYLERIFPFLGVRFIAVNDGYDSNDYLGTTGGMDVVMKCIVYGFYSKDLSQKIKTVLSAKVRKGQFIGSYAPYGYLKDPEDKHHLIPDPVAAKVVKRIFALALESKSTGEIAKLLNADHVETPAAHYHRLYPESRRFRKNTSSYSSWTCMNVYVILRRQEYTGAVVSQKKKYKNIDQPRTVVRSEKDWIIVPDCHEALVSEEDFERAQDAIIQKSAGSRDKKDYLLRSLVHCGCCGRVMSRTPKGTHVGALYKCNKTRYIAMARLKNYNGHYCESDYEYAFLSFLEEEGWVYAAGNTIPRINKRDVLIADDFKQFIAQTNPELTEDEVTQIYDRIRLVGAESDFAVLHLVYSWMVNGIQFVPQNGQVKMVALIDFDHPQNNIFKEVNQLTVEYTDNGQKENRRPDVMLYVNGMPLCVIELKNPADANATIYDAWEQINIRYWRDIPHLLHYCPLACISDGVKTRLGTVRTPYEHFYAWRRVNDGDQVSTMPFAETETMIKGVYAPARFLEIFRDYIYFQDSIYDADEREIVCRYPQFFAARLLKQSIVKSIVEKSGKGGTYFGATGCGKTYTMAFLARQLALRCTDIPQIGSPTIILIVDREDLQTQGAKLFTKSKEFLNLGEVSVVGSRAQLRQELGARQSGGFYICTIQKFCDREDDKIGLINDRQNIICFSDEAHRTQLEHSKKIQFSKDTDQNMRAMVSKPYAKVLKEAFPQATFVGFTGTPITETYQTFGDEIDRYTMDQAVADGLTVSIKYHPRIAKVLLDQEKVKTIEDYYKKCADDGATFEDVEASKRAMSSMEIILGEPSRLERLAVDIHDHYTAACAGDPDRIQKAMIVCSNRKIAYSLLQKFKAKYPEWFEEKKAPDGVAVSEEELRELKEMPFMAMVSSVGSNDEKEMYDYLGGTKNDKRSGKLDAAFKQDKSNLHIVIVVDMWITGFDVPSLTYLYNDKPLKKHMLIQTISRVNRKYPGKEFGMVIDYIGIRENMRAAMKIYGGDTSVAPTADDIEQATSAFREQLEILKMMFTGYDLTPFLSLDTSPAERYRLLAKAAEFVFVSTQEMHAEGSKGSKRVSFKTYFLKTVKRMRAAYDICQPSGELGEEESALAQCFMAIVGFVRKMSGTTEVDTDTMNRAVAKMVEEALKYNQVESVLESGEEEDIFSPEYFEKLSDVKMPATKLELLVKMLRKQINEYGKVNQLEARKFQEMLESTIAEYQERRSHLSAEEAGATQEQASEDIIRAATEQALNVLRQMNESRESFRKMGLTFEEKAFYDILLALRDQYNFEYGTDVEADGIVVNDKCKALAKKVKEIIDLKSSFADWLNNQNIRNQLKLDIKICLVKNGYPPQYSPEVFSKVMEQVENFEENAAQ